LKYPLPVLSPSRRQWPGFLCAVRLQVAGRQRWSRGRATVGRVYSSILIILSFYYRGDERNRNSVIRWRNARTRSRQRDSRLEYYNINVCYGAANVVRHRRLVRHWGGLRRWSSSSAATVGGEKEELRRRLLRLPPETGRTAETTATSRLVAAGCRCCCCCRSPSPRPKIPLSLRRRRRRWPRTGGVCVPRSYRVRIFFYFRLSGFFFFSYYSRKTPQSVVLCEMCWRKRFQYEKRLTSFQR